VQLVVTEILAVVAVVLVVDLQVQVLVVLVLLLFATYHKDKLKWLITQKLIHKV
jgi:hypothetical protein